jgi:deoxycytidylate deaminase
MFLLKQSDSYLTVLKYNKDEHLVWVSNESVKANVSRRRSSIEMKLEARIQLECSRRVLAELNSILESMISKKKGKIQSLSLRLSPDIGTNKATIRDGILPNSPQSKKSGDKKCRVKNVAS